MPHSVEANVLLTPSRPPQIAEFSSETRTAAPLAAATFTSWVMRCTIGVYVRPASSVLA